MSTAKRGDRVKVNYTGRLDDGSVFDSTENREPLEFVLGQDGLIPGFQAGVIGMDQGETKTIEVAAADAYGPHRDDMVIKVDGDRFADGATPVVGERFQMQQPNGAPLQLTVVEVGDSEITVDANHPLAGKDLIFEVSLVEVG